MNIDKKRHPSTFISAFAALLLVMNPVSPLFAMDESELIAASNDHLEQLQNYQAQLEEMESEFGPYHRNLLEPLEAMVALLEEQADYEQVAELQNRQLQLMRTVLGFEHPDLIPLVRSIINNQMRLGEWEAISENLEHIRFLQASATDNDPETLLAAMEDQAFWHLSRAYLDDRDRRVRNFFLARGLFEEMEELAETRYGEDSPAMIPWLYKQAYNKFQLVQFLNADDGVGAESVDRLAREDGMSRLRSRGRLAVDVDAAFGLGNRIPVVDSDSVLGEDYLREGFNLVTSIEEILEAENDLEAQAMAKIYRADFQLLQQQGLGIRNYREAQELLLSAGVPAERIALFFERPVVIPVDRFFRSLDEAIAYQQQSADQLQPAANDQVHLGVFTAWSESLDSTQKPVNPDPFWQLDLAHSQADLSFNISSSGRISSVDVIEAIPDERSMRRKAVRAMREIQIRPAIVEGRYRRVRDVQIRYRFIEE